MSNGRGPVSWPLNIAILSLAASLFSSGEAFLPSFPDFSFFPAFVLFPPLELFLNISAMKHSYRLAIRYSETFHNPSPLPCGYLYGKS